MDAVTGLKLQGSPLNSAPVANLSFRFLAVKQHEPRRGGDPRILEVSLLMPEMVRARKEGRPPATAIVQVDNYGLAHVSQSILSPLG